MAVEQLFTQALGLSDPWKVTLCDFNPELKELKITIDFKVGSTFSDEEGVQCKVHDTVNRKWEHLKFFEHRTLLEARVPRIKNSKGKVTTVKVPWATPHSGFTLLMEAYLLGLARVQSIAETSRQSGISEDRIWRLLETHVKTQWEASDWSSVKLIGIDETSTKKGHSYGTAFVEMVSEEKVKGEFSSKIRRLLFFTEGKGRETVTKFGEELNKRGVKKEQISEVAIDMSPSFISGVNSEFSSATICFDRFHVMQLCSKACDEVRKTVAKKQGGLPCGAMWVVRGNKENLSKKQVELYQQLCNEHKDINQALLLKEHIQDLWKYDSYELADSHFDSILEHCSNSHLKPFRNLAKTLKCYRRGIMGYYQNYTTSSAIEALNGILQLAKRRARGYKTFKKFQIIAYWIAGNLQTPRLKATH